MDEVDIQHTDVSIKLVDWGNNAVQYNYVFVASNGSYPFPI